MCLRLCNLSIKVINGLWINDNMFKKRLACVDCVRCVFLCVAFCFAFVTCVKGIHVYLRALHCHNVILREIQTKLRAITRVRCLRTVNSLRCVRSLWSADVTANTGVDREGPEKNLAPFLISREDISTRLNCIKFGQLIFRKIIKIIVATRCDILKL